MSEERSVLHVLPHPGGGGETYVDLLSEMDGYRFDRVYLATSPSPRGAWRQLAVGVARAHRAAWSHDIVHVHGEVASLLMLPALAARPSVVTTHGLHLLRRAAGVWATPARASLNATTGAASATICTSRVERDEIDKLVGARARRRLRVIHNGVESGPRVEPDARVAFRAALDLNGADVVGAWIAGLDEHKDPVTAARAALAADDPRIVLLIVGDGPLRDAADELARHSGGRVRVLGFRNDVSTILGSADFFVASSVREGLSFSLLEAMSARLAIVASQTPGNVEAVGDVGVLVPVGDVGAFSKAYARMAADDRDRAALGDAARARVEEHFDITEMIRRTEAVYAEVVQTKRDGG